MIVTVASQKGGVGKTTTAVNLAASLALAGKSVLLLDLDPQGNGSSGVGQAVNGGSSGCLSRGVEGRGLEGMVVETAFENLRLIPSSGDLSNLELIQEVQGRGAKRFRSQVRQVAGAFDYFLVDCPPSLGGLPTIALGFTDRVIIPVQCEYYAMEGLSQILPVIQKLQSTNNPDLQIGGLLLTMFSDELELSRDVVREVRQFFRERLPRGVLETVVPRDVVLAESASHGVPAFHYAPASRGTWSYIELAKEVIGHERTEARKGT